jgi:hypothetical protein
VWRDLGQQWIVAIASWWNDHYRQQFADALDIDRDLATHPLMGDINKMRNDVIHHHGIATADNTGRCEILTWFKPGDTIHVTHEHVAEFMKHLGLAAHPG